MNALLTHRSFAAIAIAFAMALPSSALADDGGAGAGGSGTTTGTGTATSSSTVDESCTVATQSIEGTTCMQCTGPCSGAGFMFVCNYDANTQVWCNGPPREMPGSIGCSLGKEPAAAAPWALGALAALAAMAIRRRRA